MINSIAQLKEEKYRLRRRRKELEEELSDNWSSLKDQLRPVNIIKDAFCSILNHKADETRNNSDSVLKSTLSFIATELADKAADKLTDLFNRVFRRKKKNDTDDQEEAD